MKYLVNSRLIMKKIEEMNISLPRLAKRIGVSNNYFQRMMSAQTKKILPYVSLAKTLNLSLDKILIYE